MEMAQPKTVVVNGHSYTIQKFYADDGLKIALRAVKIAAEPFAKSAGLQSVTMEDPKFAEILGDVFGSLSERIDEDQVIDIIASLLSCVMPEGQTTFLHDMKNPSRSTWKVHFQGRLSELLLVAYESFKENFEDFSSAWKLVAARMQAGQKAKAKPTGPTT